MYSHGVENTAHEVLTHLYQHQSLLESDATVCAGSGRLAKQGGQGFLRQFSTICTRLSVAQQMIDAFAGKVVL